MLPPAHRLHRSADFSTVVRFGDRVVARHLVVHQHRSLHAAAHPAVVGLVVSKGVGPSVVRHRISRRLRAVLAERLAQLPPGSGTVVRALPKASIATSAMLARDIDRAFARQGGRR